jgi:hypothetical protein
LAVATCVVCCQWHLYFWVVPSPSAKQFSQPPVLTFNLLCSRIPVWAQIRETQARMTRGWKAAQAQTVSQHWLHHHSNPTMLTQLHNTLRLKHGSRGRRGKRLPRWEERIRNSRRGNTSSVFSPTQNEKQLF